MEIKRKDTTKLCNVIYEIQRAFGLLDHRVYVSRDIHQNVSFLARIHRDPNHKDIRLEIGELFFSSSIEEQIGTLFHEVLHMYFRPMTFLFEDVVGAFIPKSQSEFFAPRFMVEEESIVDVMSRSLKEAKFMFDTLVPAMEKLSFNKTEITFS